MMRRIWRRGLLAGAIVLSLVAGGVAVSSAVSDTSTGPVAVQTVTGQVTHKGPTGPTNTTPAMNPPVPLSNPTFVQQAGQVVLVAVEVEEQFSGPPNAATGSPIPFNSCTVNPSLFGTTAGPTNPDTVFSWVPFGRTIGKRAEDLDGSQAIAAPAKTRVITLTARYGLGGPTPTCTKQTWTISFRVSIVLLPSADVSAEG